MMQLFYRLDLAIIQFSARDNLSALHTNKSIFSTFTSTTMNGPSIFFLQNSKEVIIFHQLTNQNSPENSIDTKFQEWRKFTSAYYLFQLTALQRLFNVSLWVYVEYSWKDHFSMLISATPRNLIRKVIWSNSEHWYQIFSFLTQSVAKILRLDLPIIQFSAYDNPLPLLTNKSIFSTFTSITINRPSFFFLQNCKEVIIFYQLTNQNSPENSIDTKFQEWRKFTSAYYLFQLTALQRLFIVYLWVYVEYSWKGHFSMVISADPRLLICKVIWSISKHWYQLFRFLTHSDANKL